MPPDTRGKKQTLPVRPASLPDAHRSVGRCKEYRASRNAPERREIARNEVTAGQISTVDLRHVPSMKPVAIEHYWNGVLPNARRRTHRFNLSSKEGHIPHLHSR